MKKTLSVRTPPAQPGMGYNGEFKIDRITLAPAGGDPNNVLLRREHDATEHKVSVAVLEGLLIENFFTDKTDAKE